MNKTGYVFEIERTAERRDGTMRLSIDVTALDAASRGALTTRVLRMGPSVELQFAGLPGTAGGRHRLEPLPLPREIVVENVEVGEYRLRMRGVVASDDIRFEPATVVVTAGREVTVHATLSRVPCIAIDAIGVDGASLDGPLTVELLWGSVSTPRMPDARFSKTLLFSAAPYIIPFAPPGAVEINATRAGTGIGRATIDIEAGGVSRCTLELRLREER